MVSRWEVSCEFRNSFMQEDGRRVTVKVTATKEHEAKHEAQLETCRKLGLSTMMHKGVKIHSIKNLGRA
jgi:hypothetical protein